MATRPLAMLVFAAALMSAAAPREIRHSAGSDPHWTLVVPVDSPVKFSRHEHDHMTFDGRFVLTGEFALTLMDSCIDPDRPSEECLTFGVRPDSAIANRLPRYKTGGGSNYWITIRGEKQLIKTISSPEQRSALLTGRTSAITGRTSIVVDEFHAGVECDSSWFSARFVAFAAPPKLARTEFRGGAGCGH